MFTGIIEAQGNVSSLSQQQQDWRLSIYSDELDLGDVSPGDSIAVNGCCLTVVEKSGKEFSADVSNETLRCTTLGELSEGARVNLEKAMLPSSRLGGHIVSGHVDGVAEITSLQSDGDSLVVEVRVPDSLARYIAAKGSVTLDGTSLTVNSVRDSLFSVNIIPHTQANTIIGRYQVGTTVNIEVDLVARYLERLMQSDSLEPGVEVNIDKLKQQGLIN